MAYTPFFDNSHIKSDENFLKALYYEDQEKDIDKKFPMRENGNWILVHGEFIFPKINSQGILSDIIVANFKRKFYPAVKKANSERMSTQFLHEELDKEKDENKKRKIFHLDFNLTYDDFCLIVDEETKQTAYALVEDGRFEYRGTIEKIRSLRVAIPTLVPSPKNGDLEGEVEFDGVIKSLPLSMKSNGLYETDDKRRILRLKTENFNSVDEVSEVLNFWYNGFGHSAKVYIAALTNQLLSHGRITYKQQTEGITDEQMNILNNFIEDYNRNPSKYGVEKLEE